MNRGLSLTGVTGTVIWGACAVKILGYVWESYSQSYDKSAFDIGHGSGTGPGDVPIIPPLRRKDKPGGGKTRLPRPAPFPKIPPAPVPTPTPPTGSPWDTVTKPGFSWDDVLHPGRWLPDIGGFLGDLNPFSG